MNGSSCYRTVHVLTPHLLVPMIVAVRMSFRLHESCERMSFQIHLGSSLEWPSLDNLIRRPHVALAGYMLFSVVLSAQSLAATLNGVCITIFEGYHLMLHAI